MDENILWWDSNIALVYLLLSSFREIHCMPEENVVYHFLCGKTKQQHQKQQALFCC